MHVMQTVGVVALLALAALAAFMGADLANEACVAARPIHGRARCAVQSLAALTVAALALACAVLIACA